MATFIKATKQGENHSTIINLDKIQTMEQRSSGVIIKFENKEQIVIQETLDNVKKMIKNKNS